MEQLDRIKFYNRDTSTWSPWYKVLIGYEGSFVYNKDTDKLTVNLIIKQDTKPDLKINDWTIFGHFDADVVNGGAELDLTFDSEGLPVNHEQYEIGALEMEFDAVNVRWYVKLALKEPIESMRGKITQTLSFTNSEDINGDGVGISGNLLNGDQFNINLSQSISITGHQYTAYTALKRVLQVHPTNNDDFESGTTGRAWWWQIKILDEAFLDSIDFTDDTFTAADLYTILFKFDDYIDRTPVMYFDIDPVTGMPSDITRPTYLLKFERKDGFQKPTIDYAELTDKVLSLKYADTIDNYATGIVSEVDNLNTNNAITFPNVNDFWAVPQMDNNIRDTKTLGAANSGQWFIELPYAIRDVISVRRMTITGQIRRTYSSGMYTYTKTYERKISTVPKSSILENSQYLASNPSVQTQNFNDTAFWYIEGENRLNINEYYYNNDGVTSIYQIKFVPLANSSLDYGSNQYQISVNQNDSSIETTKYTSWLSNYLEAMGKSDIVITKKYYNFVDFSNLCGSRVVDQITGEDYIISQVGYQNLNFYWNVVLQLNKDNYRRSLNVQASQQIRPNSAIPFENMQDRRMRIKHVTKLSLKPIIQPADNMFSFDIKILLSALIPGQVTSNKMPQVALFRPYFYLKATPFFVLPGPILMGTLQYYKDFLMNFSVQINTKQIQFNLSIDSNYKIGVSKIPDQILAGGGADVYSYYIMDVKSQLPLLYTDVFGSVLKFSLFFSRLDAEPFGELPKVVNVVNEDSSVPTELVRTVRLYTQMAKLPEIEPQYVNDIVLNSIFNI